MGKHKKRKNIEPERRLEPNILELLKATCAVIEKADFNRIPREKIDAWKLIQYVRNRKPKYH